MTNLEEKLKNLYEKVPLDENKDPEDIVPESYGWGARHMQAALFFMCISTNLIARAHPAVTIVAMVHPVSHHEANVNVTNETTTIAPVVLDEAAAVVNIIKNQEIDDSFWDFNKKYSWAPWTQEVVLGAFFVGYAVAMWPVGMIVQRVGGKKPLQVGLFVSGILAIATPFLASVGGWPAVAATRVMTGLAQAGTFPGTTELVARWTPKAERATLGTYVFIGSMVGTVISFQLGGLLSASPWGWPASFYASGTLCLVAFTLFTIFGHRSPAHHPTISNAERNYVIGKVFTGKEKGPPTPWRHLLTSRPVWASLIAQLGSSSTFMFMFTQAPTYLHCILGINVKSSGLLSSAPYAANVFAGIGFGVLSDYCTNRRLVSVRMARISCNTISAVFPAICLMALGFTRRPEIAIPVLVLAMTAHSASHTGWMVNYIDLTPNFSGTVMATGNTLMNAASIGLPLMVAQIVTDQYNPAQWRVVLFVLSGVSLVSNAVFVAFMSPNVQPWNEPGTLTEPVSKEIEALQNTESIDRIVFGDLKTNLGVNVTEERLSSSIEK